ncbi:unnamed protein product [Leptosia nina]|uniref:Uncharacterized protein n=1 Tax=Leptosia nina TaxID=320188 RepID=A0AAV1IZS8_9NEOP
MSESSNSTSWSELLANIVVNNINIFRQKTNDEESEYIPKENVVTKIFSGVFKVFKTYVYDKLKGNVNAPDKNNINVDIEDKRIVKASINPKDDVEVIEPQYHGKLCEDCDKTEIEVGSHCPEGSVKDDNGGCIEVKPSKFIVSVPHHCPMGFKPDWLGYCREQI